MPQAKGVPDGSGSINPTSMHRRIGTIQSFRQGRGEQCQVTIELRPEQTLAVDDLISLGIPVPENNDPPIFFVRQLEQHGRRIQHVTGPGLISFSSTRPLSSEQIGLPICLITSLRSRPTQ